MVVFSDGSKAEAGSVGYGYVVYRGKRQVAHGRGRLGLAEVFDGEAEGARAGLRQAIRGYTGGTIHVCLDNTSVMQGLRGDPPTSSQDAFLDFQAMAAIYDVRVHWVPGHQGIPGNLEADRLAKEGSRLPVPPGQPATAAGVKRLARA